MNFHRSVQYHPRLDYGNSWYNLGRFLLGNANFNGVSTELLREEVQRFLIWALQLNYIQKRLGWTAREWGQLSPRDTSLLFYVLFKYPTVISLTCLILWKQMDNVKLEYRILNGGLSGISPIAFMNFLRIYMISFHEYGWRNWNLSDSLPRITNE